MLWLWTFSMGDVPSPDALRLQCDSIRLLHRLNLLPNRFQLTGGARPMYLNPLMAHLVARDGTPSWQREAKRKPSRSLVSD